MDDVSGSGGGRGVPGVVGGLGTGRGAIPGTLLGPSQYPYLVHLQPQGPTYGQMKQFYEVSEIGSRIGSRIDPE